MYQKIKEKLSAPIVQLIIFSVVCFLSILATYFTIKYDTVRNTPDDTDPRAVAVVTSVSSYTITDRDGVSSEHFDAVVEFSVGDDTYQDISIYDVPFKVEIGSHINIKYDELQPAVCSVVNDPPKEYSIFAYIIFASIIVFSIFGIGLSSRRIQLKNIRENAEKKLAEQGGDGEDTAGGYNGYDGKSTPNPNNVPFTDTTDYNAVYDYNKGIMDTFYDAESTYTGYDEGTESQDYNSAQPYTGYEQSGSEFEPYTGYEQSGSEFEPYTGYEQPDSEFQPYTGYDNPPDQNNP